MRRLFFGLQAIALGVTLSCASGQTSRSIVPDKAKIAPYVAFLQEQRQEPVDYVMDLFEKHDIVILCERFHAETTQYDLIFDVISDPRFIDTVGNVFTEIGTSSMREEVRDFLFAENLDAEEIEERSLNIYRNLSWMPIWEKYNSLDFLRRLYSLNSTLPLQKKINLYYSDMPFSWEGMSREKYKEFYKTLGRRDRIMADNVIQQFNEIAKSQETRKKAFVIMNYRHAFSDGLRWPWWKLFDRKGDNVGRYLFEEYPGKVANVMINSMALLIGSTDQKVNYAAIQGGKWDAAFEMCGNPDLGFYFSDSPFGEDAFDFFPYVAKGVKYSDVFTGFIFYRPLDQHNLAVGLPGFFDDGYDEIILERMEIFGKPITDERPQGREKFITRNETLRTFGYDEMTGPDEKEDLRLQIDRWIEAAK